METLASIIITAFTVEAIIRHYTSFSKDKRVMDKMYAKKYKSYRVHNSN